MSTTQNRTIVDRDTARKVVGSLAVIGTAAAVAGLGTYGTFTDSTTPIATTVATGALSVNLTQPGGAVAIPVTTSGFLPGDSMTRAVNLVNDGAAALSSVALDSVATASSLLDTDKTNGLQLAVKSCSVAWTQGGTSTAPTYTCPGTERTLTSGSVVRSATLDNPASLNPGGVDHLTFTISLPTSAGNDFQGKSSSLSLTFTGVQRAASAR